MSFHQCFPGVQSDICTPERIHLMSSFQSDSSPVCLGWLDFKQSFKSSGGAGLLLEVKVILWLRCPWLTDGVSVGKRIMHWRFSSGTAMAERLFQSNILLSIDSSSLTMFIYNCSFHRKVVSSKALSEAVLDVGMCRSSSPQLPYRLHCPWNSLSADCLKLRRHSKKSSLGQQCPKIVIWWLLKDSCAMQL